MFTASCSPGRPSVAEQADGLLVSHLYRTSFYYFVSKKVLGLYRDFCVLSTDGFNIFELRLFSSLNNRLVIQSFEELDEERGSFVKSSHHVGTFPTEIKTFSDDF